MLDDRLGDTIRLVRRRRGWTQHELGARSGTSGATVSRLERGHADSLSVSTVRQVAGILDVRVRLTPMWRGGDLDRLLNRRHSALSEAVVRRFGIDWPGWRLVPEASFAIFGERGFVDLLGWHDASRTILVIELKTAIVDVNELLGILDRKRRLAGRIAVERGWAPECVATWLIVGEGRTSRRQLEAHRAVLRTAMPSDGRTVSSWLAAPSGAMHALSFWQVPPDRGTRRRGRG